MGKIKLEVCEHCGKVSCDGSLWRYVKIVEYVYTTDTSFNRTYTGAEKEIDISKIPEENMESCTLAYGVTRRKFLKDKKIGDKVRLEFKNWANPSWVIVQKIAD